MLHTSLLTFLPSPLLISLPPPTPLQFRCCLCFPVPWHLFAPHHSAYLHPHRSKPLFSPSLFHYAPGVCSLSTLLWSHVARTPLNSHCLPGALSNLEPSQKRSPPPPTLQIPHQGPEWHMRLPIPLLLWQHVHKCSFPPLPRALVFPSLWVFNIKTNIRNPPLGYGCAGIPPRCCATIPE